MKVNDMKLLILSDTHRSLGFAYDAIEKEHPDAVVHLGDHLTDAEDLSFACQEPDFYYVPGNCDYAPTVPQSLTLELDGVRIFVTHGHLYGVKRDLTALAGAAKDAGARLALFGHTHIQHLEERGGITLLNPGTGRALRPQRIRRGRDQGRRIFLPSGNGYGVIFMILAIDIGNTNIVLGCMEHDRILVEARMATDLLKTSDQYCVELKNLLNLYEIDPKSVEGVIISSVVPPVLNSCKTAVRKLTGKTPMIVGPGIKTGLNIQMENPAQIGSDLIVAAVAALSRFKPPLIIVDMGTATTMTAIDKNGTYVGGCISPGPKLSAESLSTRTAQLPAISLESPKKAIGKNTVDAMRSGVMLGSACMVDGMIDRMEEELGGGVTVVATGGIARFVLPMCRRRIEYDRDLLLKGLSILYENNRREK